MARRIGLAAAYLRLVRCLTRVTIAVLAASVFASKVSSAPKEYLARSWSAQPLDFEVEYEHAIRRILGEGISPGRLLRTVMLPPFDPEDIVGLVRSAAGYRAFDLKPLRCRFGTRCTKTKRSCQRSVASIGREHISGQIAARLAALWRCLLADRRNYRPPEKGVIFVDSTSFVFYAGGRGGPPLTANTHRLDRGTKTWEVISVGDAIYHYARGDVSEAHLDQRLREAEAKLGLRTASNQAMQRMTQSRPLTRPFGLKSTSHAARRLRSLAAPRSRLR